MVAPILQQQSSSGLAVFLNHDHKRITHRSRHFYISVESWRGDHCKSRFNFFFRRLIDYYPARDLHGAAVAIWFYWYGDFTWGAVHIASDRVYCSRAQPSFHCFYRIPL